MSPDFLVDLCLEAFWHPGLFAFGWLITPWTRHARCPALTSVRAFPWHLRVLFTDPAAILAESAFHPVRSPMLS